MTTTKVQDLTNIGSIQTGDKLVGERVDGTTVRINFANDISQDTSPTLGGDLDLGDFNITNTTPTFTLTPTELSYLDGVTSAIQTQLDTKYTAGGTTQALGTPTTGTLTNCTGLPVATGVSGLGTGVATFLGTPSSANLASAVTDETGNGALVFATSPALTTPNIGTPSAGTLTNCTGLPLTTGVTGTLPVANGGTGITSLGTGVATFLATPSSANLASALTDETGSGAAVFATSPTLTTPNIGTPSAGTLTNCTGLPIATGVSGLASGVATFLATPTSANLLLAVTNETGSGLLVFATGPSLVSPTLTTPALGTPTSGTLTNCTGYPVPTATQAEQETGSSTAVYVTPGRQQYHSSAAKVWCLWNTVTTTTITASYNVTSLTDNGTGDTTINLTVSFSSANYSTTLGNKFISGSEGIFMGIHTLAAGSTRIQTANIAGLGLIDTTLNCMCAFGDQ